jgi:hypothetical protein
MLRSHLNRRAVTDLSWWQWALTVPVLVAQLAGYARALPIAMVLCAAAGVYFWFRLRQVRPYPVQVRIAYLGLLAVGALPAMQWIHWVQLCGTTAMVTVGYCPLIRLLSLLPWNRTERFSFTLAWRVFFRQPCAGGMVCWPTASTSLSAAACALPSTSRPPSCSLP